jgi:hypothetical protein
MFLLTAQRRDGIVVAQFITLLGSKCGRSDRRGQPQEIDMYLVQVLLPLYDNYGSKFDEALYNTVRSELVRRFGGITAYSRAPAHGLWNDSDQIVRDDLVIYEIMLEMHDESWWHDYRKILESRFQQQSLVIRSQSITLL